MGIYYVDYVNGDDGNDGLSWVNAKRTIQGVLSVAGDDDEIRVAKSPDSVSLGNATWTPNSDTIALASAKTYTLDNFTDITDWNVSTYISKYTDSTYWKIGNYALKLYIQSSFTTGKAAWKDLGSSIDLSSYTKLNVWIRPLSNISANALKICLCSDANGDTIVDEFIIPYDIKANYWHAVTLSKNGGGSLGSSIRSVAIYVISDVGSCYVTFDNLFVGNDLGLQSLIAKSTRNKLWYAIRSIDGTNIVIGDISNYGTSGAHKFGIDKAEETVETLCRNPIVTDIPSSYSSHVQEATYNKKVTIKGGFNTSSDTQDGYTFYSGVNGWGYGLYFSNDDVSLERLYFCHYYYGFYVRADNGDDINLVDIGGAGNRQYGFYATNFCWAIANGLWVATNYNNLYLSYCDNLKISNIYVDTKSFTINDSYKCEFDTLYAGYSSSSWNISNLRKNVFKNLYLRNNFSGLYWNTNFGNVVDGIDVYGNYSYGIRLFGSSGDIFFNYIQGTNKDFIEISNQKPADAVFINPTLLSEPSVPSFRNWESKVGIQKYNGSATDHRTYTPAGKIFSDTVDYRTSAPCAKIIPTLTAPLFGQWNYGKVYVPLKFKFPVDAGSGRTLSIYIKKTSDFDGKVFLGIVQNEKIIKSFTDVTSSLGTSYSEFTVSLTSGDVPDTGVMELEIRVEGGSGPNGSIYVDDFSWS